MGGGDGNLAHWRDSIASGLRSFVSLGGGALFLPSTKEKEEKSTEACNPTEFLRLRGDRQRTCHSFVSLTLVY